MPNVLGCVKKFFKKPDEKDDEEKKRPAENSEEQGTSSSAPSYPYCESFDHLVSQESYEFHKEMADSDLQMYRTDVERCDKKIQELTAQLEDPKLEDRRRKWIESDLTAEIRKHESARSRVKLAEKMVKIKLAEGFIPPPPYSAHDPKDTVEDLQKKNAELVREKEHYRRRMMEAEKELEEQKKEKTKEK
ncbi:unnamed protein product [Caenorhabditis sp. 36 PRJEB53466]|nr:unnamed protein product [Caenorhabditis sp. 36 PRJEB53466]